MFHARLFLIVVLSLGLTWVGNVVIANENPGTEKTAENQQKPPAENEVHSQRIDQLVAAEWAKAGIEPSKVCDDQTFVRRVYLDLCGRVPTQLEADIFLKDNSPKKRPALIDQLIESQEYAVHMADVFDIVLMGRTSRGKMRERQQHGWRAYLEESFASNRNWRDMARDMTLARATEITDIRASWFLYERNNNHQAIAEAVAPTLLGIRVECAQCHDHPLADEILQAHYWGLVSFFKRGKNSNTKAGPRVVESAIGGFDKFTDLTGENFDAELTFFASKTVAEKKPEGKQDDSEDLYSRPIEKEPRVPKFSRRQQFVDQVLLDHPLLAKAFTNRIWALLLGRGIVHPVDRMDSTHDPSHPELLEALAADFEASGFDVKGLVRKIANTRVYQLDSRPATSQPTDPKYFAHGLEKPITAESYLRSMMVAIDLGPKKLDDELLAEFRRQFGAFFAETATTGVAETMFLSNHPRFNQIVNDDAPLLEKLRELKDAKLQVDFAFQQIFGRSPDQDELDMSLRFLQQTSDRSRLKPFIWAMLTSAEFRFNH